MNNFRRRLFSLVVAMFMVCSFSAVVASADEVQTTNSVPELYVSSAENSARSMMALTDMVEEYGNFSAGKVFSGTFFQTPPEGSYITIVIQSNVSCTVTVNGQSKYIASGNGKYTICTAGNATTNYSIRFHSSGSAVIYQFFVTDYSYN